MTKRARISTQDVIDAIYSDDEDDFDVDDPDEPFMEGSDDNFLDLDGELDDDSNDDDMDTDMGTPVTPHSPTASSPATTAPGSSLVGTPSTTPPPGTLPALWTTNLQPVTITPFQSAVGPMVPVPDSPLDVFELLYTAPLMQMIVDESNR